MIDLTTEMAVRKYQKGMGGVDRGDQQRETGAGFCRKAHFKKWYKKSFMAICDFMLLNSFIAWNMAAGERHSKKKRLLKSDFNAVVAEEMLAFTEFDYTRAQGTTIMSDEMYDEISSVGTGLRSTDISSHVPEEINPVCQKRVYCTVCKTEGNIARHSKSDVKIFPHTKRALAYCTKCQLHAHTSVFNLFKYQCMPGLEGKSCFEILHSETCNGMWSTISEDRVATVRTHKVYRGLCVEHGLEDFIAKKRKK